MDVCFQARQEVTERLLVNLPLELKLDGAFLVHLSDDFSNRFYEVGLCLRELVNFILQLYFGFSLALIQVGCFTRFLRFLELLRMFLLFGIQFESEEGGRG